MPPKKRNLSANEDNRKINLENVKKIKKKNDDPCSFREEENETGSSKVVAPYLSLTRSALTSVSNQQNITQRVKKTGRVKIDAFHSINEEENDISSKVVAPYLSITRSALTSVSNKENNSQQVRRSRRGKMDSFQSTNEEENDASSSAVVTRSALTSVSNKENNLQQVRRSRRRKMNNLQSINEEENDASSSAVVASCLSVRTASVLANNQESSIQKVTKTRRRKNDALHSNNEEENLTSLSTIIVPSGLSITRTLSASVINQESNTQQAKKTKRRKINVHSNNKEETMTDLSKVSTHIPSLSITISTVQGNSESNIKNSRKNKRERNVDFHLHNKKENVASSSKICKAVRTKKRTASAAASSASSINTIEEMQHETECMICENVVDSSNFIDLLCGHNFHSVCMESRYPGEKSCPLCVAGKSVNSNVLDESEVNIDKFSEVQCVICMDTEVFTNLKCLPCGHCFHGMCVQTWYQHNVICPICMPVTSVNSTLDISEDILIDEILEEVKCMICMDTQESTNFESISCGHSFHSVCILTWFRQKLICPICMPNIFIDNASYVLEDDVLNETSEEVRCLICLDTAECNDFEYIACFHRFHVLCIATWFSIREEFVCPICNDSQTYNSNLFGDENFLDFREHSECVICMDNEASADFKTLMCDHSFHITCIQSWFQINNSCPICMPNTTVSSFSDEVEEEDGEDVKCAICMDSEETSEFKTLSCNHSFHTLCIQNWCKRSKSCPNCRRGILENIC